MASTLQQQITVDKLGPDQFISTFNPARMGNTANIAYGGCTIGAAIQAACQTVSPDYILYSVMGNYLGPALTDRQLQMTVRRVRDTRTFATRVVEVDQELDGGKKRLCMILLADFQVKESATLLTYSTPPSKEYSSHENCLGIKDRVKEMVQKRTISQKMGDQFLVQFGLLDGFFDVRSAPEGVMSNNLNGLAKTAKTPQDGLPITSKTSGDWFRCRHSLENLHDQYAGLGFVLDGALSFLPLAHNGMFLNDAKACSTLDFALRFFSTDLDLSKWHLREMTTITGGNGRTYSESRLWDEQGNMVASMTQQSILRPWDKVKKASL